ncbi:hypothetical protein K432DRAFT_334357 [Lepidopterella palustris CBS 459.81]|uniref:Peptidase S59 domain-containing protein n=1 Tax=Lepidopterella palustris CBS 459.81 TaxID=1314670 RepID=A0A8E2JC55_9PEZI|nr:hypothetical protein K432DRAFT_334357 [Lepidopterella palustris CBS 459.81]
MSGFGGFAGFGSNNQQQQQNTGFGGFGASTTNTGGFGSNTGFGSSNNTSGGGLFGNTSGGFGSGGFGSTNTSTGFGAKPFGGTTATSGGSLFGGTTSTAPSTGFGGFGSTANNTSSAFGTSNTGGGLFGTQNKPAFGTNTTNTGGGIFGGSGGVTAASTGFGANTGTTGFGVSSTGFGASNQQASNNGTATTPFNAFIEKDGGQPGSQSQHYQTITMQQPYQNWSLEELRLADYSQGRRFGNQNGQAGAFGQNTGFGGFGASNTNSNTNTGFGANTSGTSLSGSTLFGGSTTTNTGFGAGNTSTGFGAGATASPNLFGQNKPATGGLFGATATTNQPSGGLFGSSGATGNTGSGFGAGTAGFGSGNTGGGLFGQQNQTQNKPAFAGGFGTQPTGTGTTGAFGTSGTTGFGQQTNTSTGGGLFGGSNTTTAPTFGTNQQNTGSSLFGGSFGQNQQNQTQNQGSSLFGGGFGANANQQQQQKPSLFNTGTANTGSSLFGQQNSQPQQQPTSLFGNTNTQQQGGGLFGQKPATTGTSLFGNTSNTGTGGGLFSNLNTNQNQQQNQGSSLFGQQNQQQQQKPLFGTSTNNTGTGGGLFGGLGQSNTSSQPLGGSLFNSTQQQQQQPQQQQMNNSIFGNSQSGPPMLTTNMNTLPWGNEALFQGVSTPNPSPGPLATPLSSSQKTKKAAILPQHKINPAASSRLITPQKRGGYGFSYSTYGTPGSAISNASPGYSSSLMGGGSFGRSLGKSLSTSNLRNNWNPDDSILSPGAFSTTGRPFNGAGSMKRLNVNRNLNARLPLFGNEVDGATPSPSKKSVSFDQSTTGGNEPNGITNGALTNGSSSTALVLAEPEETTPQPDKGRTRSSSRSAVNGNSTNGASSRPEMTQVTGSELAVVPENGTPIRRPVDSSVAAKEKAKARLTQTDQKPGAYWMEPDLETLRKMTPAQLKKVHGFTVGREGLGTIQFGGEGGEVDLSTTPLDKILGDIVIFKVREANVYGEDCTIPKPPQGKGLNVPSIIVLENSWPRARAGKVPVFENRGLRYEKHLERLKRVVDTKFISYENSTGDWTFSVEHFSTYGLYYDDEEDSMMESSMLSAPPDTPTQIRTPGTRTSQMSRVSQADISMLSPSQSSPDDTFEFKKGKRTHLPGEFEVEAISDEDEDDDSINDNTQSFLDERSVGSPNGDHADDVDMSEEGESESAEEHDMAGSFSGPVQTTEQPSAKDSQPFSNSVMPKSILKATQTHRSVMGTPSKGKLVFEEDWAEQLQRTVSPKKQDRQALRESQGTVLKERDENIPKLSQSFSNGKAFATSIDLMNSLFGQDTGRRSAVPAKRGVKGKGFELPYAKKPKTADELDKVDEKTLRLHDYNKPRWSVDGTFIYASSGNTGSLDDGILTTVKDPIVSEHADIRFAKLVTPVDAVPETITQQRKVTEIQEMDGAPIAAVRTDFRFDDFAKRVAIDAPQGVHEQQVWQLASILFDECDTFPDDVPREHFLKHQERFRKDRLSEFWETLVFSDAEIQVQKAKSPEEKALAYLSAHNIVDACNTLLGGRDMRLASMVAQIGGGVAMRQDIQAQLEEWQKLNVISEISDPIRAMYELLAGNCGLCEGKASDGRENKVSAFKIASHFGFDWRRAFGLRLWYGTLTSEPIQMAIAQFAYDLREGREDVKPVPWFVEKGVDMGWKDPEPDTREDVLWGILKLYAAQHNTDVTANAEDIFAPQNISGNPLNARLSFQLSQLFKARAEAMHPIVVPTNRTAHGFSASLMSSTSTTDQDDQPANALGALCDAITCTYASTLHTTEHWPVAIYVYLHLSSSTEREHYIRTLLSFYASALETDQADPLFRQVANDLYIPVAWFHSAKALQARAEGDRTTECEHLLDAGEMVEAHEVLCRSVAPRAIIERDYDSLRELLGGFESPASSPAANSFSASKSRRSRGRVEPVEGWSEGGMIYFDFIHLMDLSKGAGLGRLGKKEMADVEFEVKSVVKRLAKALEGVAGSGWESRGLEEQVALSEIAGVVAEMEEKKNSEKARVLRLPLTEDKWLTHTRELSVGYYRAVLAAAR